MGRWHYVGPEMERRLLSVSRRNVVHFLVGGSGQLFYTAPEWESPLFDMPMCCCVIYTSVSGIPVRKSLQAFDTTEYDHHW